MQWYEQLATGSVQSSSYSMSGEFKHLIHHAAVKLFRAAILSRCGRCEIVYELAIVGFSFVFGHCCMYFVVTSCLCSWTPNLFNGLLMVIGDIPFELKITVWHIMVSHNFLLYICKLLIIMAISIYSSFMSITTITLLLS